MTPQEMAQKINALNGEIHNYQAAHGQWAAKRQTCRGHVQALHNRQMPNNEHGMLTSTTLVLTCLACG